MRRGRASQGTPAAVFFDLDGTLTDPGIGITRSIQFALDRLGCAVPDAETLGWCIGPPLRGSFAALAGEDKADAAVDLYRERYAEVGWRENTPYPGIAEVLGKLAEAGFELHVATAKPRVFAEQILDHFELTSHFGRVFAAELDGTRSRKEDLLAFALRETGSPVGATMIGDREHDVVGARANAMRSIGVTYGYGSREELRVAGADRIVDSPREIPRHLAR